MVAIVLEMNTKLTTVPNTSFLAGVLFLLSKSTIVIDISIINDMIIALSKRVNGGINMRVKCPDCGVRAPVFAIEHKDNKDVDLSCRCINTECLSQFVMTVAFMHHTNKHKKVNARKKSPRSVISIVNNLNTDQQRDLVGILTEMIKKDESGVHQ
ncbi:Ogr/Delta-like zinc finger protein [Buttiauxella gaviniae ATCC 51604]|uniref:Ogr/Delta-like zinc finger protein n=1 Tax=Buttiauxella gaviniae ATCC 51604 TaxID=1354253 RepID=A0A1B7HR95_9ENTR|nr:Ogr/Delta-like zinc finger protein [Buttiauxella gaviniae ATCC 51604]